MKPDSPAPHVLLAVCRGIAAYKACSLVRKLQHTGMSVAVMQTRSSLDFVGEATFAALTGRAVLTDKAGEGGSFPHLDAGREADLMIIAPATAETIARLALGHASDVVSATYLGFDGPVIACPAMNVHMWAKPAVQRNVRQLIDDGVHVIEPGEGMLACGDVGAGRLTDLARIVEAAQQALST